MPLEWKVEAKKYRQKTWKYSKKNKIRQNKANYKKNAMDDFLEKYKSRTD